MKHNPKITFVLLAMFIASQLIGIYVVSYYSPVRVVDGNVIDVPAPSLPFGLETPQVERQSQYQELFIGIIIAFILAILIFLFLTKFKVEFVLKLWFFIVVVIALSISFLSILSSLKYAFLISFVIPFALAAVKIYGRNFL